MTASRTKKLLASLFVLPFTPVSACCGLLLLVGLSATPMLAAASCDSPLVVKRGDTLSGISQRCNVPINVLLINNPQVDDSGVIHAGERLAIPTTDNLLSANELDALLAPVALYPDIVLGEVLPASTYPLEIVKAARWLEVHPGKYASDDQAWAASVKALTHYPDTLTLLNDDIDWTVQLGESFLTQPDAVLDSVQRLRKQADVAGNLKNNSLQDIIREPVADTRKEVIRIVHADPDVVYVPVYDSHSVYLSNRNRQHYRPSIHFGVGLPLGIWVSHGLDWHFGAVFNRPYFGNAYSQYYARNYYRNYRNRRVITSFTHRAGLTSAERHWRHDYRHDRRHRTWSSYGNRNRHRDNNWANNRNHRRTINGYTNHIDNRHYARRNDNKHYDRPRTHDKPNAYDRYKRRNQHYSGQNRHNSRHNDGSRGVVVKRPRNADSARNAGSVRNIGEYNRHLKTMRGRDLNNAGRIEGRMDDRAKRRTIGSTRLIDKAPRQTITPQKPPRTAMPVKMQDRRLQVPQRRMPAAAKSYSSRNRQVVR